MSAPRQNPTRLHRLSPVHDALLKRLLRFQAPHTLARTLGCSLSTVQELASGGAVMRTTVERLEPIIETHAKAYQPRGLVT